MASQVMILFWMAFFAIGFMVGYALLVIDEWRHR
jgi:hypothetical protein